MRIRSDGSSNSLAQFVESMAQGFFWAAADGKKKRENVKIVTVDRGAMDSFLPCVRGYLRWRSAGGQDQRTAGLCGRRLLEGGLTDLQSDFLAGLVEHRVQPVRSRVNLSGTHTSPRPTDTSEMKH